MTPEEITKAIAAEHIELRKEDIILICPGYAFKRKTGGKRSRPTKARVMIELIEAGRTFTADELSSCELVPCTSLDVAGKEIDRVADIIHKGKYGVGILFRRLSSGVIACELWRD